MLLAVAADERPDAGSADSSDEGTYDEDPKVAERGASLEHGGSNAAGGVHAGAGVADADEVNEHEGQTDGEACEVAGALLRVRGAEHNEDEHTCEDDLGQQTAYDADTVLKVVSASALETRIGSEQPQESRADEGTDDLEEHVEAGVLARDALREEAAQRDGWVDVATADAADGISHRNDGQTKRHGGADNCLGITIVATKAHGYAATHENEHHCAHHFC